jgi:uncharacterized protein YoxC
MRREYLSFDFSDSPPPSSPVLGETGAGMIAEKWQGGSRVIIEVSVAVIAAALVILVIFLIRSLNALTQTLLSVNQTLADLKGKVENTVEESSRTLKEVRFLVEDVRQKSQKVEHLFDSLGEMGKSLQEASTSVLKSVEVNRNRWGNAIALLGVGIELAKKWRQDHQYEKGERGGKLDGEKR